MLIKMFLNWHGGGKKTVLFDPTTNTPIFTTAPSSRAYCAFATTIEDLEAPCYHKETVLQYPGRHLMGDEPVFAPEEFVAEDNLSFQKDASVDEGVKSDDETVKHRTYQLVPLTGPPLKQFNVGFSPLILHLQRKRERTSTSSLPTIKLNSCDGTTASVILPSQSSKQSGRRYATIAVNLF